MRISDWSSDVCSSDLRQRGAEDRRGHREADQRVPAPPLPPLSARRPGLFGGADGYEGAARALRSARLQRRHVPGLERDCGEEPRRHRCAGLRQCHLRRRRHAPPRHHREDSLRSLPAGSQSRKRSGGCRIEMYRSLVTGCGAYLPAQIVTNADLAKRIDTTDEWIRQRTGIHQRHVAADGERSEEHTSELQSLMRISYAVFCLKKKNNTQHYTSKT